MCRGNLFDNQHLMRLLRRSLPPRNDKTGCSAKLSQLQGLVVAYFHFQVGKGGLEACLRFFCPGCCVDGLELCYGLVQHIEEGLGVVGVFFRSWGNLGTRSRILTNTGHVPNFLLLFGLVGVPGRGHGPLLRFAGDLDEHALGHLLIAPAFVTNRQGQAVDQHDIGNRGAGLADGKLFVYPFH